MNTEVLLRCHHVYDVSQGNEATSRNSAAASVFSNTKLWMDLVAVSHLVCERTEQNKIKEMFRFQAPIKGSND